MRDLEDLIIDAMYANIIGGKLNQERGILSVDWVIGRDVSRPEGMESIQAKLAAWSVDSGKISDGVTMLTQMSYAHLGVGMLRTSSARSMNRSQRPNRMLRKIGDQTNITSTNVMPPTQPNSTVFKEEEEEEDHGTVVGRILSHP